VPFPAHVAVGRAPNCLIRAVVAIARWGQRLLQGCPNASRTSAARRQAWRGGAQNGAFGTIARQSRHILVLTMTHIVPRMTPYRNTATGICQRLSCCATAFHRGNNRGSRSASSHRLSRTCARKNWIGCGNCIQIYDAATPCCWQRRLVYVVPTLTRHGRDMIIVITGGNSFLARHLIPYLVDQGSTIFATYRTADSRLEGLRSLRSVHLVQLDVSDREQFSRLPRQADALLHIAAESVARAGSIRQFISCNVIGAENVARYAQAAQIKKAVYSSSVSIYGDVNVTELEETCPITNPDDYGLTKFLGERVFAETMGLPCVALRLPGILGKGAHRAWIPSLFSRVLQGRRKVCIYNPRSLFNNAAHVEEVSKFIWLLLNTQMSGFAAVNVAADDRMTIAQVIELMGEILGEGIDVKVVPAPKRSFTISSERAKNLGYKTRSVENILRCYFEESVLGQVQAHVG